MNCARHWRWRCSATAEKDRSANVDCCWTLKRRCGARERKMLEKFLGVIVTDIFLFYDVVENTQHREKQLREREELYSRIANTNILTKKKRTGEGGRRRTPGRYIWSVWNWDGGGEPNTPKKKERRRNTRKKKSEKKVFHMSHPRSLLLFCQVARFSSPFNSSPNNSFRLYIQPFVTSTKSRSLSLFALREVEIFPFRYFFLDSLADFAEILKCCAHCSYPESRWGLKRVT